MNYLNLKGTPKEIGFQCGKYFAEQGINISVPPEEQKKRPSIWQRALEKR